MKNLNFKQFFISLISQVKNDDVLSIANELTYKILISFFPLLIFLMTILGFLNIDSSSLIYQFSEYFPEQVMDIILVFIDEVIDTKNIKLLSTSLIFAIFSASNGFRAIIRGINRAYSIKDTRNFFHLELISISLVFVFAISVIIAVTLIVFGDIIINFLVNIQYFSNIFVNSLNISTYVVTFVTLICTTMVVYKLSLYEKVPIKNLFPGSIITVIFWILSSKVFNIYITNFSKFSRVYGSIASIIVFLFWLNMIIVVLLLGCEVNALIYKNSKKGFSK